MSINNFIPGSSLFRKHLEKIAKDDEYYHIFCTQTLLPDFCLSKTVNEQYKESMPSILKKVSIFHFAHIVTELHENGNVHYHMLLSIKKDSAHKLYDKTKIVYAGDAVDQPPVEVQTYKTVYEYLFDKYKTPYTDISFNHQEPFCDFRVFEYKVSFLDYLHKDIDRLYSCANGWKTIKFLIYSKLTKLEGLKELIHFKHK